MPKLLSVKKELHIGMCNFDIDQKRDIFWYSLFLCLLNLFILVSILLSKVINEFNQKKIHVISFNATCFTI